MTAEKSELIQRVDHRILELALKRLAEDRTLYLSVNMSGHIVRDGLISHWRASPGAFTEVAKPLNIEFTETCAIEDIDATVRAVDEI